MSARDELQRWVDGVRGEHPTIEAWMPVKLARRVLAEMDEPRLLKLWEIELLHDAGWEYAFIPEARQLRAALAAALSTLAEVRAEHQPDGDYGYQTECVACGTQWPCTTTAILDRSTP